MIKNKVKFGMIALTALVTSLSACKKDKDLPDADENELITKVSLRFVNNANPTDVATVTWADPDGDGGIAPTIGTLTLKRNTTYAFEVSEVLNETATTVAARNVLAEIISESFEHLWVYKPATGLNVSLVRTDRDRNNLEIGIKGIATVGNASTGRLQVILRHQPNAKNGTEAPGSTDFDASFNTVVQ